MQASRASESPGLPAGREGLRPSATGVLPDSPATNPRETFHRKNPAFPPNAWAQLQAQALELREHLLDRQRELDRREAQLNARSAELENELRKARLRISQQQQDLGIRQAELQQVAAALAEREQRLAASERALERRSAELYQVAEYLQQSARQRARLPDEPDELVVPPVSDRESAADFLLQPPSRRSAA